MTARLRMGLVGGGPGSFIGPIHRIAAELDNEIELVAGAFSSDADRSRQAGERYHIAADRAYASVDEMIEREHARADGIDFITIASPNWHHFPAACAAIEGGLAVMSDKPMTATVSEAYELALLVHKTNIPFALSYTYSGYPLVREMRQRVAAGAIGNVRKVVVEYSQGWLAEDVSNKQADWRLDPATAGIGGCIADIGVHAFHLAEFICGARVNALYSDLAAVVPGRLLDDDCSVLLRFENGARGILLASQIEFGEQNGLRIRIYGTDGAMIWRQEQPTSFLWHRSGGATEIVRAGDPSLGNSSAKLERAPGGHPEGYLEAFANLYRDFAALLRGDAVPDLPGIEEGLRGMAFIDTAVRASANNAGWVPLKL